MSKRPKMCKGYNCPLKDDCFRHIRKPHKEQEYYQTVPYDDNGGRCDFYLPKWVIDELKTQKTNKNESTYNNYCNIKRR